MTDTSPPSDHAPQPPLAEGEREAPDHIWLLTERYRNGENRFATLLLDEEGEVETVEYIRTDRVNSFDVVRYVAAEYAQMTRERDAAVAREATLREALETEKVIHRDTLKMLDQVRKALEPFAVWASVWADTRPDDQWIGSAHKFNVGHLRVASAALSSTSEPESGA